VIVVWLTLASFASWFVSTLAGGGTPLLLIPVIGFFLGPAAVPPILTTGMLLGHPQRLLLYWQDIDWELMKWYSPGAIIGAALGGFVFTQVQLQWLPILIAFFLLISALTYSCGKQLQALQVRAWYFLPAGFVFAFLSGIVGSTGPLLNPLYLNYGLLKEQMIATKSAHLLVVHIVKMITYGIFGAFTLPYLGYGLLLGLAAIPGNWLGQIVLQKLSQQQFRYLAVGFVAFSGFLILGNELVSLTPKPPLIPPW
jgi:uncharacterized membrane protein YfcA